MTRWKAIGAAYEQPKHQIRRKCVAGLLIVWNVWVIGESGIWKMGNESVIDPLAKRVQVRFQVQVSKVQVRLSKDVK